MISTIGLPAMPHVHDRRCDFGIGDPILIAPYLPVPNEPEIIIPASSGTEMASGIHVVGLSPHAASGVK